MNLSATSPTPVGQPGQGSRVISLRCPACRQRGTFETLPTIDIILDGKFVVGQRRCPNPACYEHMFFVFEIGEERLIASYPAERIDFDTANVPDAVVRAMEEAITCHSNQSNMAAAMMVRKTLEELCEAQGAKGENLKARLRSLGTKVVLPTELMAGLDDLRLLGNDAAHVESRTFNEVGPEEVEVGIEFTKEVLKAAYQYESLLRRLRSLRKDQAPEAEPAG